MGRNDEADEVGCFLNAFKVHPALKFHDFFDRVDPEEFLFGLGGSSHESAGIEPTDGVFHIGQQVVGKGAVEVGGIQLIEDLRQVIVVLVTKDRVVGFTDADQVLDRSRKSSGVTV